jgi:hypothetical protein
VLRLESLEIANGYLVVPIRCPSHIHNKRRSHEPFQRDLVRRVPSFREVNRRIEVRASVLGSLEVVGGVVVSLRGNAGGDRLQREGLCRGPVDRGAVERIGEIDPGCRVIEQPCDRIVIRPASEQTRDYEEMNNER